MSDTYAERLRRALAAKGLSQSELARRAHVRPSAIQYLCSKGTNSKHTSTIARVLGVSAHWLDTGDGSMESGVEVAADDAETLWIPLLSSAEACDHQEARKRDDAGRRWLWLDPDLHEDLSPANAFAIKVHGSAMRGDIGHGDTVIVDTSSSPRPGDIVLACVNKSSVVLRRYRQTLAVPRNAGDDFNAVYEQFSKALDSGFRIELHANSEDYAPIIESQGATEIEMIGPVIAHHRRIRDPG